MDLPLVSIAAINYNNSGTVIDTLESIRAQTYPNIELIIVDDCSTDNCVELIIEWLKCYGGKYKLICHETNKGVCATYNSGLNNASGKYFSAIDTDDIMLPEKTERQVNILEGSAPNVAGVYSDAYRIDINGLCLEGLFIQNHRQFSEIPTGNIYDALLQGNYIPCMTFLFKKRIFEDIGGYDETLVYEDYDMWLRIAKKYEILFSDFVSSKYRIRPGSLSFTIKNWISSDARIFIKHIDGQLPIARIRNIALEAYSCDDKETMSHIREIGAKTSDSCLMLIFLFWQMKISPAFGCLVVKEIQSGETQDQQEPKRNIFVVLTEKVLETLPSTSINQIARDAYAGNTSETMPLIRVLMKKTQNRYLKAAYLLWKYKVFVPNGLIILSRIDGYCNANVSNKYIDLCIYKDILGAIRSANTSLFKRI
jgi:glycosyltransferase involved in cell wall biosynthesis